MNGWVNGLSQECGYCFSQFGWSFPLFPDSYQVMPGLCGLCWQEGHLQMYLLDPGWEPWAKTQLSLQSSLRRSVTIAQNSLRWSCWRLWEPSVVMVSQMRTMIQWRKTRWIFKTYRYKWTLQFQENHSQILGDSQGPLCSSSLSSSLLQNVCIWQLNSVGWSLVF